MNGWSRAGRSRRWHQVEYDSRTGLATLACSTAVNVDASAVMDYRWRPPVDQQCQHPQCQAEVLP